MGFWADFGKNLLTKVGERSIYERGFEAGKSGQPRQLWRYDSDESRALYSQGYDDGSSARQGK